MTVSWCRSRTVCLTGDRPAVTDRMSAFRWSMFTVSTMNRSMSVRDAVAESLETVLVCDGLCFAAIANRGGCTCDEHELELVAPFGTPPGRPWGDLDVQWPLHPLVLRAMVVDALTTGGVAAGAVDVDELCVLADRLLPAELPVTVSDAADGMSRSPRVRAAVRNVVETVLMLPSTGVVRG